MNLARVEYYLSDILSIIETRHFDNDQITTDTIAESDIAVASHGKLFSSRKPLYHRNCEHGRNHIPV